MHSTTAALSIPLLGCNPATLQEVDGVVISDFELIPVRATQRTVWLFLQLHTNSGLIGLGEASDAFGYSNTTAENVRDFRAEVAEFLSLVPELSPLNVARFRQLGRSRAQAGLVSATAYSAIEQALWDLAGQLLNVPTYQLLGGKLRDSLPVYANINRAARPRTPEGFAGLAKQAWDDGFRAMKAAPFDNFPVDGTPSEITAHIEQGIDSTFAMRDAIGRDADLMIDCHSFFSVDQAVDVARSLEPANLAWYEEPVAPSRVDRQALIQRRSFDVIMSDVKHCGGLTEFLQIAAMAADEGIIVSPHNPSGPVSTAASIQVSAGMTNFNYLELQYGEVDWRTGILNPPEVFADGGIEVPRQPGFGITLNEDAIREYALPL